jgi:hypothetical protein
MTEITTYQPQTASLADYQSAAVHRLGEWAQSADAAYKVAERLVQTSFVPVAFRGKPIEATAAILAGTEVGLSPMSALRAFDVIQGQAAPRAITLRAIVQSYGHEVVLVESTGTRCRMKGRRRGSSEWQTVTWTMDRARDLGLASKDGWKKQPAAMLMARATSELCRLIAADAILGIGYSSEEVVDGADVDASPVPSEPSQVEPARTMSWQPEGETAAEPEQAERTKSAGITKAQQNAMHAAFNEVGISDRDERLAYTATAIGREVASSNELTKAEASTLIDALKAHAAEASEPTPEPQQTDPAGW